MRVAVLAPLLLGGCAMDVKETLKRYTGTPDGASVEDRPDMTQPLGDVHLRVGVFASQEVRERACTLLGCRIEHGQQLMGEVEAQFRRVFDVVTPVYKFPPPRQDAEGIDVVIVVEAPELESAPAADREHRVRFRCGFCVCTISGARIDPVTEEAACRAVLKATSAPANEGAVRDGVTAVVRGAVYGFLRRAPSIMNKRYDK